MMSLFGQDPCSSNVQNSSGDNINDPPNLVRCTYNLSSESQNCGGLQATTIVCQKCARHEVRINASPPPSNDPCFTRIPKNQRRYQDQGDSLCGNEDMGQESCTSRRKRYGTKSRGNCIPYNGPLTEYQDAYRKRNPRAGPRLYPRLKQYDNRPRPAWNNSIAVRSKPYQESLEAAEAKLKALDVFEDPPPDVMALAIIRDQVKERYREKRKNELGGNSCYSGFGAAFNRSGRGGGHYPNKSSSCFPSKPTAIVKGSHMELVEEESVVSDG